MERETNDTEETSSSPPATEQRVRRKLPLTRKLSEEAQKADEEKKDLSKPGKVVYMQFKIFKFYTVS